MERPRRTGYPLVPVIGLAEGETRWRGMTAVGGSEATKQSSHVIPRWFPLWHFGNLH